MVKSSLLHCCIVVCYLASSARAVEPNEGNPQALAEQVSAIFQTRCAECHNADDPNGGLDFSAGRSLTREADSGLPAIVPGRPEDSELLRRVTSVDEDLQMPPDGPRLEVQQVSVLTAWIAGGADWKSLDSIPTSSPKQDSPDSLHWAFQPLTNPVPPVVEDPTWALNPIDLFIQSQREEAGMSCVDDATPTTLIRRLSYDLTGLPPSPAAVADFQRSVILHGELERPLEQLIDRLLSETAYGQRWGRHWMDWVRYADTAGDNSDFPIPQAYLYRNYLIDSINEDLPYDRFLTEQLAGDLLPAADQAERNRLNIATGYLAMARRFGSLVETYPWHLTIEDTIDNVGRTMMGLTLACARCHDHKFDPISTRDYYGLYGIFASTRYPFPGIELFQVQNDMVPLLPPEQVAQSLAEHQAKTEELTQKLKAKLQACRIRELENAGREKDVTVGEQRRLHDELQDMLLEARNAGTKLADHLKQVPRVPTAYAVGEAEPGDARIQIKGEPTRLGAEVPRRFPTLLGGQAVANAAASGRLELAGWIASHKNPLTARVIVNRVWQRHFGRGLVASTSDFGTRGQTPSHPALLDWLAQDFILHGWSLKHLHRTILTSRTYRLDSQWNPSAAAATGSRLAQNQRSDPENKYYWRFNRQRLDAESIRDTLLLLAGNLDRSPRSNPYPIPDQSEWEYTQHHPFKDEYSDNKRSVYQMVKRLTAEPYMQTFDGPDPNVCTSRRDQSVTALQALFFVNDDFLHAQSKMLSASLLAHSRDSTEDRIPAVFQRILGRAASESECDMLQAHLSAATKTLDHTPEAPQEALASVIRGLLRTNEFIYID